MNYKEELYDYIEFLNTRNASDIHILANVKPSFRENRELNPFVQKEVLLPDDVDSILSILLEEKEDSLQTLKDKKHLQFSFKYITKSGATLNFRITAYIERGNTAIAMRLIRGDIPTIVDLNLPPILKNIIAEPNGLFLIVGSAGHGKSTTLASMIEHCNNTYRKHILTIEDPVEFLFKSKKSIITQREVPADSPSFRSALDSALRADADLIMIGEMRETQTMRSVMTAAEVGHLVLSTVHANSTHSTINRIIDSFEVGQQRQIANQLSSTLIGVCSIRLLPKISGGLVPACELLLNTPAVSNLIRENRIASIKSVIQTGREEGMITLENSLADLVKNGSISLETANLYADNSHVLNKYL